jgi:hypothetical protein
LGEALQSGGFVGRRRTHDSAHKFVRSSPIPISPKSDGDLSRPLPHNLEAERAVLGAILLDNHALDAAVERLRSEDFFLSQHRQIFQRMIQLGEKQQAIDTVTLMEDLGSRGELEAAGGVAYLSQLTDGLPRATNVEHYARIVKEKALLRSLAYSAAAIQERALAAEDDADVILASARQMLAAIPDANAGDELFDTWEEFQNAKPLRSLIENCFQADVCNVIGGLAGDGKTLILGATTKALLTGKPLFGYFKVLEVLERVVYLIPECARTPFFHRIKLFGLENFIQNGRLKVRTLSKGLRVPLNDPRLLNVVRGAAVLIDTAVRFLTGEENDAGAVSSGLATDIFGLLAAGAVGVGAAHHAAKSFEKENRITLETVLRGSGDFGAFVGAGFGIRQIDESQNIIHLEDIKPRDAEPFPPFQIIGRPYINEEGDFRMHRKPGDCGRLAEYLDIPGKSRGGAPESARGTKVANKEFLRQWLREASHLTSQQLQNKFWALGVTIDDSTIRKYRKELGL